MGSEPDLLDGRRRRRRAGGLVVAAAAAHRHTWRAWSRHRTSEGTVDYERCSCGSWRVLLGSRDVLAARPGHVAPRRA